MLLVNPPPIEASADVPAEQLLELMSMGFSEASARGRHGGTVGKSDTESAPPEPPAAPATPPVPRRAPPELMERSAKRRRSTEAPDPGRAAPATAKETDPMAALAKNLMLGTT
eukprot:Skav207434  [mRNA]  locus=scaffold1798:259551:262926:+ [translate_table: standard]